MSDDRRDAEGDESLARRNARDGMTPGDGIPLVDAAFAQFDVTSVPPRPPLPPAEEADGEPLDTGDHTAIREQWRAARDELGTHMSHARDQLDQANERISNEPVET